MPHPRSPALAIVALLLLPGVAPLADEPATLTDEQRQGLQAEAARLWEEAQAFDEEGKLTEALAAGEKMLAVYRKLLDNQHQDIAFNLEWLADRYDSLDNFATAKKHRTEVVTIKTHRLGKAHWQVTDARWALHFTELLASFSTEQRQQLQRVQAQNRDADRLHSEGKFIDAEKALQEAADIQKALLGEAHPNYAWSLNRLADLYYSQADYARAEPLYRQVSEIWKTALGEAHPSYATSLNSLANLYESQGQYARAEPLFRQALEVRRTALGKAHPDYAQSLNNLAQLYQLQGENARAEPLFLQASEILKTALGEAHPDYATILNNLAGLYSSQGNFARAEPLYHQALEVRRTALGTTHPDYAQSLNNLALLYHEQGRYARAEPFYREALEIRKTVLGEAHPAYATSLNNLAGLYYSQGEYARAEPLHRQVLEIRKNALGDSHPDYALSLTNLALLYHSQGDYARAEPLYRQASEVLKAALGEAHPDYALSLNNLAGLYDSQGDHARAEPLHRQALEIRKNALGEAHPDYALSLTILAGLYDLQGNSTRAEALYRQASEVLKTALGDSHPDYALSLNQLALLYHSQGNSTRAEPLYRQALEIRKAVFGEAHPDYARSLNNLAGLYGSQGEYSRAESLFRQAIEITKTILGENHPDYALYLNNLAGLYDLQGDDTRAEPLYRQVVEISLGNLQLAAVAQSERAQLAMAGGLRPTLDAYLALAVRSGDHHSTVYEQVVAWKGAVLARQQAMRVASARPELAPVAAELQTTTRRLASLALAKPQPEQAEAWRTQIAELSAKKEVLEQKLSAASAEFRVAIKPSTVADLCAALPADRALVDFLEYSYSEPKTKEEGVGFKEERRIAAFVVGPRAGSGDPRTAESDIQLVDLGAAAPIVEAIDAWRGGFGMDAESRAAGNILRAKLWLPIEKHLAGATTVLISPDGDLGKLPFAVLPGQQPGTYLLEEYTLAVVPSARAIVDSARRNQTVAKAPTSGRGDKPGEVEPESTLTTGQGFEGQDVASPGNLLVLGGVDYDRRTDADPADVEAPKRIFAARAVRDDADQPFDPLPGTSGELARIKELYGETFGTDGILSLKGSAATQDALVAAASQHLYLHLATHGYFASPKYKSALDRTAQDMTRGSEAFVSNQSLAGYHPGLLSGIALAGANQPTEEDDGILTAEEIGSLNLDRCELVVLSACETGLGQAAGGEGLLGVQRAFQAAGAKTVIASLWKVDDNATRDLMERFYENLWSKTKADGQPYTKLEALREAQLWMLKERGPRGIVDAEGKPADAKEKRLPPYFWAAFVLSGDWR